VKFCDNGIVNVLERGKVLWRRRKCLIDVRTSEQHCHELRIARMKPIERDAPSHFVA
jgi:hypothetical protein